MTTEYCNKENVDWVRFGVMKRDTESYYHEFELPGFMEPHAHMFENWERERYDSQRAHLKQGDVFYDVGAETGWMTLLYASMVGAENMVLIEPCEAEWPNIRATWERNIGTDIQPLACHQGFMSDTTNTQRSVFTPWPADSVGPLVVSTSYKYIWESSHEVTQMRLDDFCARLGRPPRAINIDVEGAELRVLRGAEHVLKYERPLVWVSIHPDLMRKWYTTTEDEVHEFMASCGYAPTHLSTDHEQHWLFEP